MGRKIKVMAIVNLTDDSYFSESRCLGADGLTDLRAVRRRVSLLLDEGADIIDLGACSTRPGSKGVGAQEEWRRLEPALRLMMSEFPETSISIDTYWADVVRHAAGYVLPRSLATVPLTVNDISAGLIDREMLDSVAEFSLPYIAMHMVGTPEDMQSHCDYPQGVTAAVRQYFEEFSFRAEAAGVKEWILDPGFGFSKTLEQNYELLKGLDSLCGPYDCGRGTGQAREILVGVSRKSMIYRLFSITPEEALAATQAVHMCALTKGATILRVHDAAEARRTVEIFKKIL